MLHWHETQAVQCDFIATETKGQLLWAELLAVVEFWPSNSPLGASAATQNRCTWIFLPVNQENCLNI